MAGAAFDLLVPKSSRRGWNELVTSDVDPALGFYGALFGWENREIMKMGPMGGYHFLDLGGERLGAAVSMTDRHRHWNVYITVEDVAAAVERAGA